MLCTSVQTRCRMTCVATENSAKIAGSLRLVFVLQRGRMNEMRDGAITV